MTFLEKEKKFWENLKNIGRFYFNVSLFYYPSNSLSESVRGSIILLFFLGL